MQPPTLRRGQRWLAKLVLHFHRGSHRLADREVACRRRQQLLRGMDGPSARWVHLRRDRRLMSELRGGRLGFKRWFWALEPIDLSKKHPGTSGHARGGSTRCILVHYPAATPAGVAWQPGSSLVAWRPGWCWLLAGVLSTPRTATTPTRSARDARRPVQHGNVGTFRAKSLHIPRRVAAVEPCGAGTGDFGRLQPAPPPASRQALLSPKPSGRDSRSDLFPSSLHRLPLRARVFTPN